jgi:hypothetical protein
MILVDEKPYKMSMKWQSNNLCFLQFGDFFLLFPLINFASHIFPLLFDDKSP